jgi:L-lysine 6-transaminase
MAQQKQRLTASQVTPDNVLDTLGKHLLLDGSLIVFDLKRSVGSRLFDEATGRSYLDFFMCFATCPIGFNHPRLIEGDFLGDLTSSAVNKISNSDYQSVYKAELMEAMEKIAMPKELPNVFLIDGGTLAVENALKAAFDWKVRKNFARGAKKEIGTQVIHFKQAFHGRSGYTLSLTNTNPAKTDYFPKFKWPRISNPRIVFPLDDNIDDIIAAEEKAALEIEAAIEKYGDDIAALIIEPVQAEGGDNHFRHEFMHYLRKVTEENEIIFILDEVQTGVGTTGKFWAYEHFGIVPDIIAFGKKMQVCGIMASDKLNEVDSVFKIPSRINSTWGGNLTDMVRAKRYLQVIHEENLVENAREMGEYMLSSLGRLRERFPDIVTSTRGLGLMIAFDLPDGDSRGKVIKAARENGLIIAGCGDRSIRFRPALNLTKAEVDEGMTILDETVKSTLT